MLIIWTPYENVNYNEKMHTFLYVRGLFDIYKENYWILEPIFYIISQVICELEPIREDLTYVTSSVIGRDRSHVTIGNR